MTVSELRELLIRYDDEAKVEVEYFDCDANENFIMEILFIKHDLENNIVRLSEIS